MNDPTSEFQARAVWMSLVFAIFLAVVCLPYAMADDTSASLGVIPAHSDMSNLAFANAATGAYYFKFDQSGGGGINAVHIASSAGASPNFGDVTTTTSQSGTFYITETGGRGYQDEAILMVAVKGDIPSNCTIHIRSSGYSWVPTGVSNQQPTLANITYHDGAVDQTFGPSQFIYGPQNWRPAGNNVPYNYPIYNGQDTTDTTDTFDIMFVDLKAGPLGSNGALDTSSLQNNGAIRVDYTIQNLNTVATFDVYAWNDATSQGNGISWSNGLTSGSNVPSMISGYTVLGPAYAGYSSEFPTVSCTDNPDKCKPRYNAPTISLAASAISGPAPLDVAFTGTSQQSVKTWSWDFGDGSTASVANTNHTFTKAGTYTVTLTGTSPHSTPANPLSTSVTQTITVTSSGGSSSAGGGGSSDSSGGISSSGNSSFAGQVSFIANVTTGVAPLAVQFNDTSTFKNISAWDWNITGSAVMESFNQNPVFVFPNIGNYTVNLTVTTSDGSIYNLSQPDYIQATVLPASMGSGWVSSDQYTPSADDSPDPGQQQQDPVAPAGTTIPASLGKNGYSPLGTKVAGILMDCLIVTGVIGAGVIVWKKL